MLCGLETSTYPPHLNPSPSPIQVIQPPRRIHSLSSYLVDPWLHGLIGGPSPLLAKKARATRHHREGAGSWREAISYSR
jgi:hypothetical protein